MAIPSAAIRNTTTDRLRSIQATEQQRRRSELEAARAQALARQAKIEAAIQAGETPYYDAALKRSQQIQQTNNQTNNQTTKQTNSNITTLQLAKTGNSLETAKAINNANNGTAIKIGNSNYTLSNNQAIPETKLKSSEYLKTEGQYNSYSDAAIEHAKQLQQSGNILQKVAASIYLGANNVASAYESFVDNNNKYGVKVSQGETHDTGDSFNDWWMDVAGNIILTPSALIRNTAAGTLALTDVGLSDIKNATEKFGSSISETVTDPKQLTAIGLTAIAGGGVSGAASKVAGGVSKTVKGTKVTAITKNTGKQIVIDNTKGSITLDAGKTVTIPIGTKSVSITKGKTSTGATVRDVTIRNTEGQTTKRVSTIKSQTVTENKPISDAVTGAKTGNIEIVSTSKATLIRGKNHGIVTDKIKNRETTNNQTNNLLINGTGTGTVKGNTRTVQTGKAKSTKYVKRDKTGDIHLTERTTGKITRRNIESQYVQQNTRARITTRTDKTTEKRTETKKEGEAVKRTTTNKRTGTIDTNTDINIGNTNNQLPGKTTKTRTTGTQIKIDNGELIVVNKNTISGNRITISTGNKSSTVTKGKATGIRHKGTTTKSQTPNRIKATSTVKNVERPMVIEKAKIKTEKKTEKAKAKEDRKKAKAEAKADRKQPIEIVGQATTDSAGRVTRYFPRGYVRNVKRVNRQIHTGRLSKADKDYLQNRRNMKMERSGDAEALYRRRQVMKNQNAIDKKHAKEARKTEEVKGVRIEGIATFNESGRITRRIPKGYKEAVLKVHRDIKKGKLSQADIDYLQNRRANKLSESGDAEALYNRRQTMKAQAESDARKAQKNGTAPSKNTSTRTAPKTRRTSLKKSNSKNTGKTTDSDNTNSVDAGNGMMYAMKTKTKTTSKPQQSAIPKQQQKQNTATKQNTQKTTQTTQNNKLISQTMKEIKTGKITKNEADFIRLRAGNKTLQEQATALINYRKLKGYYNGSSAPKQRQTQKTTTKPQQATAPKQQQKNPATTTSSRTTPKQKRFRINRTKLRRNLRRTRKINNTILIGSNVHNQRVNPETITVNKQVQQQQQPNPATTTNGNGTVLIHKETTTTSTGTTNSGTRITTTNNKTNTNARKDTKQKTRTETAKAVKRTTATAVVIGTAVKPAQKQAVAQETKQAVRQKQKTKAITESKKKKKTRIVHLDEDSKKKRKVIKSKKPKTAIRIETINQFGWLGLDKKKAAKARKIRI